MEKVVDQMWLIVLIPKHPETIANIVDTPNVVMVVKQAIDIFHFDEELINSHRLIQLDKKVKRASRCYPHHDKK